MDKSGEHIQYLWERYIADKASGSEVRQLFEYIGNEANDPENQLISREIVGSLSSGSSPSQPEDLLEVWKGVLAARDNTAVQQEKKEQRMPVQRVHPLKSAWLRYAAAIIIVCGMGAYFWFNMGGNPSSVTTTHKQNGGAPGRDGAVLTLADGRKLVLDSMGNGIIAHQNGAQVVLKDGQLVYDPSAGASENVAYNTMTTPKGRQFRLVLPDGSNVWLNAASSITYPTAFTGKQRIVEIRGEAYLEVAKNSKQPFYVKIDEQTTVEVLGTNFNINAYRDEPFISTTLVGGLVKVTTGGHKVQLKPGQQALAKGNRITVNDNPNIEQVLAWKNGLFDFQDLNFAEAMRQVERWYDVQVVYEEAIPDIEFTGGMDRGVQLSDMMQFFKDYGIKTRMDGRKLIIGQYKDQ